MLPDTLEWFRECPLASAILVSLAIHATALTLFPQLRPLKSDQPSPLRVEILDPPRDEPRTAELPSAVAPLPEAKRLPTPPPERPHQKVPKAVPELAVRQPAQTAVAPTPSAPEVLTAAPEAPSRFSVPAAPVPSAAPVRDVETASPDPDLLAGYGRALSDAIGRYQRYPRLAEMRGWQGTVTVALKFGAEQRLVSTTLQKSSGHEILDEQALEMVKDAQPLPRPPAGLRNGEFSVLVPIAFRLN